MPGDSSGSAFLLQERFALLPKQRLGWESHTSHNIAILPGKKITASQKKKLLWVLFHNQKHSPCSAAMLLLTHSFGFEPSLKDDLNVFLCESFWRRATQQALNTASLFFVCTICGFVRLGHTSQLSQSDIVLTGARAADYREKPQEKTAHHTQHLSCIKLHRGGNFAEFQR